MKTSEHTVSTELMKLRLSALFQFCLFLFVGKVMQSNDKIRSTMIKTIFLQAYSRPSLSLPSGSGIDKSQPTGEIQPLRPTLTGLQMIFSFMKNLKKKPATHLIC